MAKKATKKAKVKGDHVSNGAKKKVPIPRRKDDVPDGVIESVKSLLVSMLDDEWTKEAIDYITREISNELTEEGVAPERFDVEGAAKTLVNDFVEHADSFC